MVYLIDYMFKQMTSSGEKDVVLDKTRNLSQTIWALLVPQNKQYDVFYDIRAYIPYQQQLAELVPEIRKYCCYDDSVAWLSDLKNEIYRSSKIEHYRFLNSDSGEKLYLSIDNPNCRIHWSFKRKE